MRRPSAGRGRLPLPAAGTRGWLTLAALLGVLSLGLPWATWSERYATGGFLTPGSCTTTYDHEGFATLDCLPMTFTPGFDLTSAGTLTGADLAARVLLVVVAVLVWTAYRRRDASRAVVDPAAGLAVALAAVAPLIAGAAAQTGQVAWVLGAVALVVALRRDGMLGLPARVSRNAPAA